METLMETVIICWKNEFPPSTPLGGWIADAGNGFKKVSQDTVDWMENHCLVLWRQWP